MLEKLKETLFRLANILEDDARAALIDKYFGVSDGLDAQTRLALAIEKGQLARGVIFGTADQHAINMMQNEANATSRPVREVTAEYYDNSYLPFMQAEADMAVAKFNFMKGLAMAATCDEAVEAYSQMEAVVLGFIDAQYDV